MNFLNGRLSVFIILLKRWGYRRVLSQVMMLVCAMIFLPRLVEIDAIAFGQDLPKLNDSGKMFIECPLKEKSNVVFSIRLNGDKLNAECLTEPTSSVNQPLSIGNLDGSDIASGNANNPAYDSSKDRIKGDQSRSFFSWSWRRFCTSELIALLGIGFNWSTRVEDWVIKIFRYQPRCVRLKCWGRDWRLFT